MLKGSVLLVDNDLDMLLIGQRIFGRANFKFISARNGREGLEKIVSNNPDLVILDFVLPDLDGKQFIQTIALEDDYTDFRDTPLVILTARSDNIEDFDAFYRMGLRAYLTKPFGHRELVTVVENLIRFGRSEKKLKQEQIRQQENIIKSEFGSTSVTEWLENIRQSVNTITGLCRSMLINESDFLSDRQRMDLQAIQNSSRGLARLVNKVVKS